MPGSATSPVPNLQTGDVVGAYGSSRLSSLREKSKKLRLLVIFLSVPRRFAHIRRIIMFLQGLNKRFPDVALRAD